MVFKSISRFTALLTEMGIDRVIASAKSGTEKSKCSMATCTRSYSTNIDFTIFRYEKTAAKSLALVQPRSYPSCLGRIACTTDRYYGRVDEVLSRIEAGAGRDAGEWLDLRERCLELFKVTSRAGVPEVFLLGHKLLGAPLPPASSG